ncbi:MAG: hypothetical protein KAI97_07515 [Gemmatimonadetes bacterium]|nr:hypothetical protein [Gemmatimonadota bacterium]
MPFMMSAKELERLGAAWHSQGAASSKMAGEMAKASVGPDEAIAAAAIALASTLEGLCGIILTVGGAICERLERIEPPSILRPH